MVQMPLAPMLEELLHKLKKYFGD